ncbi:hypothetical protein C0J52_25238 [Blattella germanica]|nr:hypothetical protein C0J52_25238 [Blattella germanica]
MSKCGIYPILKKQAANALTLFIQLIKDNTEEKYELFFISHVAIFRIGLLCYWNYLPMCSLILEKLQFLKYANFLISLKIVSLKIRSVHLIPILCPKSELQAHVIIYLHTMVL